MTHVSPQPQSHTRNGEEEEEEVDSSLPVQPVQLFAPKSLVLVSRLDHTEVFRVRGRAGQGLASPGSGSCPWHALSNMLLASAYKAARGQSRAVRQGPRGAGHLWP